MKRTQRDIMKECLGRLHSMHNFLTPGEKESYQRLSKCEGWEWYTYSWDSEYYREKAVAATKLWDATITRLKREGL